MREGQDAPRRKKGRNECNLASVRESLIRSDVGVKVREAIRIIERAGWILVRQRGSHRQYRHPTRPGLVTIAGKPRDDLAPKTWKSIRMQAGIDE